MSPLERQKIVARRLAEARRRSGLSSAVVATRLGRGRSTIHEWEAGNTNPTAVDLGGLAEIYDCSADWLTGRDVRTSFLAAVDPRVERFLLTTTTLADFDVQLARLACYVHEDTFFESNPVALSARIHKVLNHRDMLEERAKHHDRDA